MRIVEELTNYLKLFCNRKFGQMRAFFNRVEFQTQIISIDKVKDILSDSLTIELIPRMIYYI